MKYRHQLQIIYPKNFHEMMDKACPVRQIELGADFPYYRKQWWFRLYLWLVNLLVIFIFVPIAIINQGLIIKGRKNLWKYRRILSSGTITVCNHILKWDVLSVRAALWPRRQYNPMWSGNYMSRHWWPLVAIGGTPIPETDVGKKAFFNAIADIVNDGNWIHFYPEGHLFYYYQELRPFKKGAFVLSVNNNKPILPMAISLRPARGIYKLFKKNTPLATIEIGEPILPNLDLDYKEAVLDLMDRTHKAMEAIIDKNTPNA
jgi:1,2-diacylglycerol 3-alpha-glucosyltransferase